MADRPPEGTRSHEEEPVPLLNTTFIRVREEGVPRLRDWLSALESRRDELRASYTAEGTRHEQFFLLRDADGFVLILISELKDAGRGKASFLHSHQPLDLEFKRLIREIAYGDVTPELLFDSSTLPG
jgi:hypothetical protein